MIVTFDFHADDGNVQPVTVPDCPTDHHEALLRAGGEDDDGVFTIVCRPEGCALKPWVFRAARIHNVQVTG